MWFLQKKTLGLWAIRIILTLYAIVSVAEIRLGNSTATPTPFYSNVNLFLWMCQFIYCKSKVFPMIEYDALNLKSCRHKEINMLLYSSIILNEKCTLQHLLAHLNKHCDIISCLLCIYHSVKFWCKNKQHHQKHQHHTKFLHQDTRSVMFRQLSYHSCVAIFTSGKTELFTKFLRNCDDKKGLNF